MKDVLVPAVGESISEATVAKIFVKEGQFVNKDDEIAELETEKVNVSVPSPSDGVIASILVKEGDTLEIGVKIAVIDETAKGSTTAEKQQETTKQPDSISQITEAQGKKASPAASRIATENGVSLDNVQGSGRDGMILKPDMSGGITQPKTSSISQQTSISCTGSFSEETTVIKMSSLRKTIARRLKEAQNTAAILTTFNEVDMSAVMEMRKKHQEDFTKKFGVKLGFMSFFVKAATLALQEIPAVNTQIEGENIIYKNYCSIGVAIGTEKGLVVPVIRHCEALSFNQIEQEIINYAGKANKGGLSPNDFAGGTFTISNGGTYGSMMSTPIINPPQSAILGMHSITERAVVVNGQIVIRPMMYLALSYDHRIIDGKEAVTFLVKIKNYIENPQRMLLSC